MHRGMEAERNQCCAGCGSCVATGEGVCYYGKRVSRRERTVGACCGRTHQTTTGYEILGREVEAICGRCVLRRRLLLLAALLPCLSLMGFALAFPEAIPAHGPVRLAFFSAMAAMLFPIWIWSRRALFPSILLRDEIVAGRVRRRRPGHAVFTRREYRRMGGADRSAP
ncbi:MAG: hypothetical protein AB7E32_07305 [Desulfovibrio sp.]